jgi:hypothetical protein
MRGAAEMHILDEEVSRKKEVLTGASRTENRAIVANPEDNPSSAPRLKSAPDPLN